MADINKLETLHKGPESEGKQVFLKTSDRVGDNPNKMVIGSGTSFKGSDINTDAIEIYGKVETSVRAKVVYVGSSAEIIGPVSCEQIEIHGKISGSIDVNGKANIKKAAQVIGSIRYQAVSIEQGAAVYADLHCTKADQAQLDKVSKLKKLIIGKNNVVGLGVVSPNKFVTTDIKEKVQDIEEKKKKKRSFFS